MNVFISWSGPRSQAVAELLNGWIRCVLQAAKPWLSTHDIDSGAVWFNAINEQLRDTSVGIICLTKANRNRPWILFESGALAKGLTSSRVCTLLIDLSHSEVENPLAQFNHSLPDEAGMRKLVRTLNAGLGANALDWKVLDDVFQTYWPQFQDKFARIMSEPAEPDHIDARQPDSILAEILENTRSTQARLRQLESRSDWPRQAATHRPELENTYETFWDMAYGRAKFLLTQDMSLDAIERNLVRHAGIPPSIASAVLNSDEFGAYAHWYHTTGINES